MEYEIRPVGPDEVAEFARTAEAGFGHHADADDVGEYEALLELDRTLAVFDRGRVVGTAAALFLELTLPGPAVAAAAGITAVAVLPTHRRRGILSALMARQLDDVAARGEALAVLFAAEGGIYRRFGYGPAIMAMAAAVPREHGAFDPRLAPARATGSMRLVGPEEAAGLLPAVFDRYRRARPGEVGRNAALWDGLLADRERWRDGASAHFYAVLADGAGADCGYVAYRAREKLSAAGFPTLDVEITEVVATTPAANAALWRYCLDIDLAGSVSAWNLPLDAPLRWLLADPRQLAATQVIDLLWLRLVDVAAALGARGYAGSGHLVIEVTDQSRPDSGGRFALEVDHGAATCGRTTGAADLSLGTDALASAFLGGVTFASLAAAGRVTETAGGALARADGLFGCHPSPTCLTDF